jgi:cyclohexyl-isocyanide hydratase
MAQFTAGFVLFPGLTQLDLTGPYEVLSRIGTPPAADRPGRFDAPRMHLVAQSMRPIASDRGLGLLPTCTFADCPPLDLVCVPGGTGVADALDDAETLRFLREQGGRASYVTSVCTGAFLLGAAGLLRGRQATTHWAYADLLPLVGARHVSARVVRDGNLFTSGGVTAGIDFGLRIVAELAGDDVARAIQLGLEYDPEPPFDSGHPARAPAAARDLMVARNAAAHGRIRAALERREGGPDRLTRRGVAAPERAHGRRATQSTVS